MEPVNAKVPEIVNNDDDSSVSVNSSDLIDKSIDNLITSNNDASSIHLPSSTSRPTSLSADVDDCEIPGPSIAASFGNCLTNVNKNGHMENSEPSETSKTSETVPSFPMIPSSPCAYMSDGKLGTFKTSETSETVPRFPRFPSFPCAPIRQMKNSEPSKPRKPRKRFRAFRPFQGFHMHL